MKKVFSFLHQVQAELHKVTWPKREELVGATVIVLVFVLCFAVLLGTMDTAISMGIKKLLGQAGLS